MNRSLAALGLLILVLFGTAGQIAGPPDLGGRSKVNTLLGVSNASYHDFTDEEYLAKQRWQPKGGFCFFFDDGDSSFLSSFIAMSDSIYQGLGSYSSLAGIRIRGTTAMSINQVGSGAVMTPSQLRRTNAHGQQDFEIAGHGGDDARIGWRGLDNTGALVSYNSLTGMSYAFADTVIRSAQDSCVAWGIPALRSWGYGNWKSMSNALPEIFRRYGIYQSKQACVPAIFTQAIHTDLQEQSDQVRNQDEFPQAALELPSSLYWGGFHRIGEMASPYDIGARLSFDSTGAIAGSVDSIMAYVDVCAQMQCMGVATFHGIRPDASTRGGQKLVILESELSEIMSHVATRIQEGILESLTFEQVAARIRGIRDGNLMPHNGFRLLTDGKATTLAPGGRVINAPIGWPISPELYAQAADTLIANGTAGTNWKVFNLSTADTIAAAFTARSASGADSISYAAADTSRNILMANGNPTSNSNGLQFPIIVSGSEAKYIMLTLQVACLNGNSYTMPASAEFYPAIKALQFEEVWEDNINGAASGAVNSYESMPDLVGTRNSAQGSFANYNFERQRVRPVGATWAADTTAAALATWVPTLWQAEQTQSMFGNPFRLRPLVEWGKTTNWDWQLSFAGFATDLRFAGAAATDPWLNWNYIDTFGDANEFVYYIPCDPKVDYIYVSLAIERFTVSFAAGTSDWAIYAIDAYPIR